MYHAKRLRLLPVQKTLEDRIKDKKLELINRFGELKYNRSQIMRAISKATGAGLNVSDLSLEQIDSVLAHLQQTHVQAEQMQLLAHPLPSQQRRLQATS